MKLSRGSLGHDMGNLPADTIPSNLLTPVLQRLAHRGCKIKDLVDLGNARHDDHVTTAIRYMKLGDVVTTRQELDAMDILGEENVIVPDMYTTWLGKNITTKYRESIDIPYSRSEIIHCAHQNQYRSAENNYSGNHMWVLVFIPEISMVDLCYYGAVVDEARGQPIFETRMPSGYYLIDLKPNLTGQYQTWDDQQSRIGKLGERFTRASMTMVVIAVMALRKFWNWDYIPVHLDLIDHTKAPGDDNYLFLSDVGQPLVRRVKSWGRRLYSGADACVVMHPGPEYTI